MLTRRHLVVAATGVAATAMAARQNAAAHAAHDPFKLGVASGSPRPTSVILWTRLAPEPLSGGGMTPGRAKVRVLVARDESMQSIVIDAVTETSDAKAHSVHFKADGLEPGREYWYRFAHGEHQSPIGRTRTANPQDAEAKIALVYCQHYETGHFAAYRDVAEWLPDCVVHVGDYIYEGGVSPLGATMRDVGGGERRLFEIVRQHNGPEIVTLWDYRNRYALYRTDPDLQAAHAAAPWIIAMDDHEVDNNWAGNIPQDPEKQTALEFKIRRMAAFQAFYEHMPIEQPPLLRGLDSSLQMYGQFRFGPAQIHLLDTRQFRSDQPCGDGRKACTAAADPRRIMLGNAQERWLERALRMSGAPHNVIATQVWFTPYRYNEGPEEAIRNVDSWDGYPAARQRLIDVLSAGVANPVFFTGDWHTAVAATVHERPFDPTSRRVAVELAGSSISSGCPWARDMEVARDANPHVKYLNGNQRGYLRAKFTSASCTATYRVVADVGRRASPVVTETELRAAEI